MARTARLVPDERVERMLPGGGTPTGTLPVDDDWGTRPVRRVVGQPLVGWCHTSLAAVTGYRAHLARIPGPGLDAVLGSPAAV